MKSRSRKNGSVVTAPSESATRNCAESGSSSRPAQMAMQIAKAAFSARRERWKPREGMV